MASAKDHRLRRISPHGDARGTSAKRQGGPDPPETKVGVLFSIEPRRLSARVNVRYGPNGDPLRSGSTYAGRYPGLEFSLLAGHDAKRIVMNDAEGLRRRAENLRALAKKAREDRYIQLANYISDKADQLFEEARVREFDESTLVDKIAI